MAVGEGVIEVKMFLPGGWVVSVGWRQPLSGGGIFNSISPRFWSRGFATCD